MKHTTWNESPTYVRSVNKRDQILEKLLLKSRARQTDELRLFISEVLRIVTRFYPLLNKGFLDPHTVSNMKRIEWEIEQAAKPISSACLGEWLRMKRMTYAFSWAATQKALINAGMPVAPKMLPAGALAHHVQKKSLVGTPGDRIHLAFERLKRKVIDAVQLSRTMEDTLDEALIRVGRAFPAARRQKKLPVLTRSLVEAARSPEANPVYGPLFIDADEWDAIVEEYRKAYLPKYRDPRYELEEPVSAGEDGEYTLYPWQVEQEMTEDFVASVRAGEVDGAKAEGITDFVWIAVLSAGHTCEFCRKRDGMLTSEIEAKLAGEWADDEEDAVVPPAHPNCYCRVAPATDNIPDRPASNAEDMEDWLSS